jgi:hypothetical protein
MTKLERYRLRKQGTCGNRIHEPQFRQSRNSQPFDSQAASIAALSGMAPQDYAL